MFAGHVGAALALGRVERRLNIGWLVSAALLPDSLLWLFVLLGWESVLIPANFGSTHQPEFVFPYSHGLLASLAWSALAAWLTWASSQHLGAKRLRAAALMAAAVFSHWLIDALVHRPELPLAGAGSQLVGLGLWNRLPLALVLEAAIVVAGVLLFIPGSGLPRGKAIALATLCLVVLAFTVLGMTLAPPPPSSTAMAARSLLTLLALCALVLWLGQRRIKGPAP